MAKDVWIYCGLADEYIAPITFEIIRIGYDLARESGEKLCAVINTRSNPERIISALKKYPIDIIYTIASNSKDQYQETLIAKEIMGLVKEYCPNVFIFGGTSFGRSIAPSIATFLQTGLTADCTVLEMDSSDRKKLKQIRPAYGGKLLASINNNHIRPQMATVRPGMFKPFIIDSIVSYSCEVIEYKPKVYELIPVIDEISKTERNANNVQLSNSDRVLVIGKGIKKKENIFLFEKLANILNAKLAVTRAIVDMGWYPKEYLIGQTGVSVKPQLYIAFGVSGALQHLAGVKSCERMVAINTDPDAMIFKFANIGVVMDASTFAKQLINHFESDSEYASAIA